VEVNDIISSGLLELYVMGQASPEETRNVESWAAQYPEVAAEIAAIEKGMEIYAQAYAMQPDESVKARVMAAIGGAPQSTEENQAIIRDIYTVAEPKVRSITGWKWAAAAAVILLIGSAVMNVTYYNKYTEANKGLQETRQQLALEQQHTNDMRHDMEWVHNPNSMPVALKGMDAMPDAAAKIFWVQNTGDVVIDASSLPDAPAGMQYQFWAIVDGAPVNGGMIITNDKGMKFRLQKMKSFGKAQAFAVSLEKEGGNPTPTKVVSMGKIL
jgi:anti-sigma-K factor RskA